MDKEQFKQIDFKGVLMTVGNHGTILTKDLSRPRKLQTNSSGYACYTTNKCFLVHRIVAFAWVENSDPINKKFVNHIDGNKKNNRADNLEWVTQSENELHSIRVLGNKRCTRGLEANWKNPIQRKPVVILDKNGILIKECSSGVEAAKYLGVRPTTICNNLKGYSKSCMGYTIKYVN